MSDQLDAAAIAVAPAPAAQPVVEAEMETVREAAPATVVDHIVDEAREAIDTATAAVRETVAAGADTADTTIDRTTAPAVEAMEAAASPAMKSDINPAAASSSAFDRGFAKMATIIPPAETAEKTKAFFGDMQNRMGAAFDKSSRMGEDMVDFAKGNVEAMVASSRVAAKAGEIMAQEAAEYGRKSFESAQAMIKSLSSVKSPTELFQLQSDFARNAFDSAVAEASKMSEVMIKFAGEISQPLSNRYALAAEKLKASNV